MTRGQLKTRPPFNLEATVRVLQRRSGNPVDVFEDDAYWRVLSVDDMCVLAEVRNRASIEKPDLRLILHGIQDSANLDRKVDEIQGDLHAATQDVRVPDRVRYGIESILRRILGLDVDPDPLQARMEAESVLRSTALALRGLRPPRFANLFEAFLNVIPFQQVSLDAGVAVTGRLVRRFGASLEYSGRRFHASPTAAAMADASIEVMRECGLSARKAQTLQHVARVVASGALDEATLVAATRMQALEQLTALPGVGPWSAALVLLRGMGRLDRFPPGDVGAARALGELMHLGTNQEIEHAAEAFGEMQGYLYFYALGSRLLEKGLIRPGSQQLV